MKYTIDDLRDRIQDLLNDIDDGKYGSTCVGDTTDSVAKPTPVVQGRMKSNGLLHLQYGTPGDYKSANVEVSPAVAQAIARAECTATSTSFAGTNRKYVVGEFSPNEIVLGGAYVSNPFAPSTPKASTRF